MKRIQIAIAIWVGSAIFAFGAYRGMIWADHHHYFGTVLVVIGGAAFGLWAWGVAGAFVRRK